METPEKKDFGAALETPDADLHRDPGAPQPEGASDAGAAQASAFGSALPSAPDEPEAPDAPDEPNEPDEPDEPDLVALRSLLMRREMALLDQLRQRLDDPQLHARELSDVIAEALLLRAGKDDMLAHSLEPVVEGIFKSSLRKNPRDFTNVLFPLMGPAIRRSIAEAFRAMLESFNNSVEMAFSWKGLRWRLEALRSGKPFSEIVLLHTLIYRVEQIFLIHSHTGLVLAHEVNEGVESEDADMVSAMLTAIQDFVNDCFARGSETDLESLSLGEFSILVEKSPLAYIACVIRGSPPSDYRQKMRTSLELILVEFYDDLESFQGDTAPFTLARRYLDELMGARFLGEGKALPFWVKAMPVLLLLGLTAGVAFWQYQKTLDQEAARAATLAAEQERSAFYARMNGYVDRLQNEPGLLVLEIKRSDTPPWALICMKDELARAPLTVIVEEGGNAGDFHILSTPFISLEPAIVSRRVRQAIQPPEGATMRLEDNGTLRLAGTAPIDWILRARQDALRLPGVKSVDLSGINDPRMRQIEEMVQEINAVAIRFSSGKDTPVPEDAPKLEHAANMLVALENLCREMGLAVSLTIYGHADSVGSEKRNYELSQERARTLAAMLYSRGSSLPVAAYGMGAEQGSKAEQPRADPSQRRIELRVRLSKVGTATEELLRQE